MMMKKIFAMFLAAILALMGAALAEAPADQNPFLDTWVAEGHSAEIWEEEGSIQCDLVIGDQFGEFRGGQYDEGAQALTFTDGIRFDSTYNEDTADYDRDILATGLTATFTLSEGTLTCEDSEGLFTGVILRRLDEAENLVAPGFTALDLNDATYSVAFDRADLQNGVLSNVRIYTEDVYDIVAVSNMAVGDSFEAEGKMVTIESLNTNEYGDIEINGGYEAGGYTLTTHEDTNGWTTTGDDDFCTYTRRATVDLTLSENVHLTDSWDIDGETVEATGIEAVTQAIMTSRNENFYEENTKIVIENGKVTEINRYYVP